MTERSAAGLIDETTEELSLSGGLRGGGGGDGPRGGGDGDGPHGGGGDGPRGGGDGDGPHGGGGDGPRGGGDGDGPRGGGGDGPRGGDGPHGGGHGGHGGHGDHHGQPPIPVEVDVNPVDVNVTVDPVTIEATVDLTGIERPDDNDLVDIDLNNGDFEDIGDVITANNDLFYDPGNDIDVGDVLKGALDGKGNDVGQVFVGSNNLIDNDELEDVKIETPDIDLSPSATTGDANANAGNYVGAGAGEVEMDVPLFGGDLPYPVREATLEVARDGGGGGQGGHGGHGGHGGEPGGGDEANDNENFSATIGDWGSGDSSTIDGSADAASGAASIGDLDVSGFNLEVVLGANILSNAVDTTVVGGNVGDNAGFGDDDLA